MRTTKEINRKLQWSGLWWVKKKGIIAWWRKKRIAWLHWGNELRRPIKIKNKKKWWCCNRWDEAGLLTENWINLSWSRWANCLYAKNDARSKLELEFWDIWSWCHPWLVKTTWNDKEKLWINKNRKNRFRVKTLANLRFWQNPRFRAN